MQLGVNRGVMMGLTCSKWHPSSHRHRLADGLLRGFLQHPGQAIAVHVHLAYIAGDARALSSSSIKIHVASVWRDENMHTLVVPLVMRSPASRRYTLRA